MRTLRALMVEDDAWISMYLADMLEEMGCVVVATEGTETGAVVAAERHKPDLIIVDAGLSEGSGVNAVNRILHGGFVPHVFVNGHSLQGRALHSRAVVVEKPFLEPDLVRAIKRAIGTPEASR